MSTLRQTLIDSLHMQNVNNVKFVKASHPFPCIYCHKNVNYNQRGLMCSSCQCWSHIKCNGTPILEYNELKVICNTFQTQRFMPNNDWICFNCHVNKLSEIFPFGMIDNFDLANLLENDSICILNHLPSYEITSKAKSFLLDKFDIDDNVVSNINSKYYSVKDFQSVIKGPDSFTIFHSNLNGLESKFDELHSFVTCSKEIDFICISETSQKINNDFCSNILIPGYHPPYSIGSHSSRGGVAIYGKNVYNIKERSDLSTSNNLFEFVSVEITNANTKNTLCCCCYRHTNNNIDDCGIY